MSLFVKYGVMAQTVAETYDIEEINGTLRIHDAPESAITETNGTLEII